MNGTKPIPSIFFDKNDKILLRIVNDVLNRDEAHKHLKNLLIPYLHPHGIKELMAGKGLRIAYAVIHLLGSLEAGEAVDRQNALRSLRDEVFYGPQSLLRKNTARVLLEIMKELVRSRGEDLRQLELARDFRTANFGKPAFIRRQLSKYHLLEMPEEWNQIAFDNHVHDANTKGRKSPTHLIMDAWIKGIRHLTVIYYNFINAEVAAELLESAEIMGITVRIGIEYSARFRGRYIKLIWVPRGFADKQHFLDFLEARPVRACMASGRRVSEYQQRYVLDVLAEFNERHRPLINETCGLKLPPLDRETFFRFVGSGQPSLLHLGKFICNRMSLSLRRGLAELRELSGRARDEEERARLECRSESLAALLDPDAVIENFLRPAKNPGLYDPNVPHEDPEVPALLYLTPAKLLARLQELPCGFRVTLNYSELSAADVLELLYDCRGAITHLEIFNLKDHVTGRDAHNTEINKLQWAINHGNVIKLKKVIQKIIGDLDDAGPAAPDFKDRREKLLAILHNIPRLQGYYQNRPLKSRIGSDSTGSSRHRYGMGLAVIETLPGRVQKMLKGEHPSHQRIPVRIDTHLQVDYLPKERGGRLARLLLGTVRHVPGFEMGYARKRGWIVQDESSRRDPDGNVATLGGLQRDEELLERREGRTNGRGRSRIPLRYLNTVLKNSLKILAGFVPAFATFALTKDWWVLAYFGAFIWFGITGLRNIIQSVLGGGGIRRAPLLRWDDYVSWDRLTDSLFFTGFSVPLLDFLVKTMILDRMFHVTTATSPVLLYAIMALANGIYISGHNIFRGFPRDAVVANFFRSILSIPLAILFNAGIGAILGAAGVAAVADVLQKWAAVISKLASDCVAGIIEGLSDRGRNIRLRCLDYRDKIDQVLATYARLETLFPEADVLKMLESPQEGMRAVTEKTPHLAKIVMINALDLLHIWMYQPRAASTLLSLLRTMSAEEQRILLASQEVLSLQDTVSQLFFDGVLGKQYLPALSFYLKRSDSYLEELRDMINRCPAREESAWG